jgi:hypothetical protein
MAVCSRVHRKINFYCKGKFMKKLLISLLLVSSHCWANQGTDCFSQKIKKMGPDTCVIRATCEDSDELVLSLRTLSKAGRIRNFKAILFSENSEACFEQCQEIMIDFITEKSCK